MSEEKTMMAAKLLTEIADRSINQLRAENAALKAENEELVDVMRELLDGPEIGSDHGAVIRRARCLIALSGEKK